MVLVRFLSVSHGTIIGKRPHLLCDPLTDLQSMIGTELRHCLSLRLEKGSRASHFASIPVDHSVVTFGLDKTFNCCGASVLD